MPRYFIDFQDGDLLVRDIEGSDLDDFEQARNQAIALLPQIAKDELPDGEHREFVALIRDEKGLLLYRARLTFQGEQLARRLR